MPMAIKTTANFFAFRPSGLYVLSRAPERTLRQYPGMDMFRAGSLGGIMSSSVSSDLASLCRISAEARRIAADIAKLPEPVRKLREAAAAFPTP